MKSGKTNHRVSVRAIYTAWVLMTSLVGTMPVWADEIPVSTSPSSLSLDPVIPAQSAPDKWDRTESGAASDESHAAQFSAPGHPAASVSTQSAVKTVRKSLGAGFF